MKRPTFYQFVITLIPVILVISVVGSLIWYVNRPEKKTPVVAGEVKMEEVVDTLKKLTQMVGPRNLDDAAGVSNLNAVLAMIDGTLGEANLGYEISSTRGVSVDGRLWPVISADVGGKGGRVNVVAVKQTDEGSAMAFVLNFAEYIAASHGEGAGLRLVFYPPGQKISEDWLWESLRADGDALGEMVFVITAEVDKVRMSDGGAEIAERLRSQLTPDSQLSEGVLTEAGMPLDAGVIAFPKGGKIERRAGVLLEWMARFEKGVFGG